MKAQAFQTLWWETGPDMPRGALRMIDQSRLPDDVRILACQTAEEVAEAIVTLKVRGAPAIGVAAGYGMALGLLSAPPEALASAEAALARVDSIADLLRRTRPTAVNLPWALERMRASAAGAAPRHTKGCHALAPVLPGHTSRSCWRLRRWRRCGPRRQRRL